MGKHLDEATAYALRITMGFIPASEFVIAACQRQLDELSYQDNENFPYYFDEEAAEKIINWVCLFHHVKGEWARKRKKIELEPWQKFIWTTVFGWKRKEDDTRRFREAYVAVSRKNGKSTQIAPIGLYMLAGDGEEGSEVYCGATTEKQAWEVFGPAHAMVKKNHDFKEFYGIDLRVKNINIPDTNSKFEPLIGDPPDGSNPHCAIVDEYHEHESPKLFDTMITGMGSREQPLVLVITTAGYNLGGPCYTMQKRAEKMLKGIVEDDTLFAMVYCYDKDDDWKDPANLIKANPNMGVSVKETYLKEQLQKAINEPSKQNIFKTKHCNLWCNAKDPWMNMVLWEKQERLGIRAEDYKGSRCILGIDLASKSDINAVVQVFELENGMYAMFSHFFLPEDALENAQNADIYRGWAEEGWITLTDGAMVDYDAIEDFLINLSEEYSVDEIPYDPYQAMQLVQHLEQRGATVVQYGQTVANMSDPMKQIEALIADGKLIHDGNPVMRWCMSNVVCKIDAKDNIYPRKERDDYKIDGGVAAIIAMGRMQIQPEKNEETDGFISWD